MPDPLPMPAGASLEMDPKEVESGKTMAILCYLPVSPVNLIVTIICLATKNNAFSLYHAKQSAALMICAFGAALLCIPLMFVCVGFVFYAIVGVAFLVLSVLGIVNASSGKYQSLPVVGGFGEKWFASMRKV